MYKELNHPLPPVYSLTYLPFPNPPLRLGAVAGIVIAVAVFVILVMVAVMFSALLLYRRTRDVSHGEIIHL